VDPVQTWCHQEVLVQADCNKITTIIIIIITIKSISSSSSSSNSSSSSSNSITLIQQWQPISSCLIQKHIALTPILQPYWTLSINFHIWMIFGEPLCLQKSLTSFTAWVGMGMWGCCWKTGPDQPQCLTVRWHQYPLGHSIQPMPLNLFMRMCHFHGQLTAEWQVMDWGEIVFC